MFKKAICMAAVAVMTTLDSANAISVQSQNPGKGGGRKVSMKQFLRDRGFSRKDAFRGFSRDMRTRGPVIRDEAPLRHIRGIPKPKFERDTSRQIPSRAEWITKAREERRRNRKVHELKMKLPLLLEQRGVDLQEVDGSALLELVELLVDELESEETTELSMDNIQDFKATKQQGWVDEEDEDEYTIDDFYDWDEDDEEDEEEDGEEGVEEGVSLIADLERIQAQAISEQGANIVDVDENDDTEVTLEQVDSTSSEDSIETNIRSDNLQQFFHITNHPGAPGIVADPQIPQENQQFFITNHPGAPGIVANPQIPQEDRITNDTSEEDSQVQAVSDEVTPDEANEEQSDSVETVDSDDQEQSVPHVEEVQDQAAPEVDENQDQVDAEITDDQDQTDDVDEVEEGGEDVEE